MAQTTPHHALTIANLSAESTGDDILADLGLLNRSSLYAAWLDSELDDQEVMDTLIDELLH